MQGPYLLPLPCLDSLITAQVNIGFGAGWTGSPVVASINGQPVVSLADAFESASLFGAEECAFT